MLLKLNFHLSSAVSANGGKLKKFLIRFYCYFIAFLRYARVFSLRDASIGESSKKLGVRISFQGEMFSAYGKSLKLLAFKSTQSLDAGV